MQLRQKEQITGGWMFKRDYNKLKCIQTFLTNLLSYQLQLVYLKSFTQEKLNILKHEQYTHEQCTIQIKTTQGFKMLLCTGLLVLKSKAKHAEVTHLEFI